MLKTFSGSLAFLIYSSRNPVQDNGKPTDSMHSGCPATLSKISLARREYPIILTDDAACSPFYAGFCWIAFAS